LTVRSFILQCMSLFLARTRHPGMSAQVPLTWVKRGKLRLYMRISGYDQKATSASTAHEQEIQGNGALVGDSSKWFSQLVLQAHDIRDYVGAFVGLEHKVRHEKVVLPQEPAQPAG